MGSLNLVSTTTKQTGRPRGTDHPSQIKYNVFYKSLSPFNGTTHSWQQVTEHIHTLPEHLVFAVPGSQAMPEEWEENTIQGTGSCGSHDNSYVTPHSSLPFPPAAIEMSRKLITPAARATIYYSKYREVWLVFSMTIHAVLWREIRHNGWCVPPPWTDSIINGPTSSDYFYFILYLSCWSSCHSLRTATFSTTWLSCTQPPEL